jgi:hypothetical protein
MAYRYAAFFSYKRDPATDDWHRRVKNILERRLKLELNDTSAEIFFDSSDIRNGEAWPSRLRESLLTSKCIFCVWSTAYFQSRWCTSEWKTFEERAALSGRPLIGAARYHDGESYPVEARGRQSEDLSLYASELEVFWSTKAAVRLERKLWDLAKELAEHVKQAPAFDPNFPFVAVPNSSIPPERDIDRISAS